MLDDARLRPAFKAGVKPSQIARQFGFSQSDGRCPLPNRWPRNGRLNQEASLNGVLPIRSLMARDNSRIAFWPFVPPFPSALGCSF